MTSLSSPTPVIGRALIAGSMLAIFLLDCLTPLGYSEWPLYVVVLVLSTRSGQGRDALAVAFAGTLLVVAGFFLSPRGLDPDVAVVSRGVGILVLWLTALLLGKRNLAEAALRTSLAELARTKQHLEQAQTVARIGSWELDPETGGGMWSAENYRIFGRDPSLGPPTLDAFLDFVHPDDRPAVLEFHARGVAEGSARVEVRTNPALGPPRWIEGTVTVSTRNGRKFLYGTTQDITDRKQAERTLIETVARLTLVLEGTGTGLWDWDLRTNVVRYSREWKQLLGYEDHEVADHLDEWQRLTHPDDAPRTLARVSAFLERPAGTLEAEFRMRHKEGGYRWILSRAMARLGPDGKPTSLVGLHTDITQRKQVEALLACQMKVTEMIATGAKLEASLDTLLRDMEEQTSGALCSIVLLDEDGVHVRHGSAPSLPDSFNRAIDGLPIGPDAGSCGTAMFRREAVIVEDIATDPLWANYRDLALSHGLRACWSTPIFDEQRRVLGTFAIYYRQPGPANERHRQCVDMATHLAATAIGRHLDEAALRAKTDQLEGYFTNSLDLLCIADTDGFFRRLNPEWERTLGYPLEELEGRRFLDFIHPDDIGATLDALQRLSCRANVLNFANRFRHLDASYRWIEWRSYAENNIIYAAARDITERRQAEERLQEREQRLSALIGNLPGAVFRVRNDPAYTVEYVSEQIADLTGYPADDFRENRRNFGELMHPDDRAWVWKETQRALGEHRPYEFTYRFIDAHGRERWNWERGRGIYDAKGELQAVEGFVQDITERKEADAALRESEQRFASAFHTSPAAITITRIADGRFVDVNPAFLDLFEFTRDEVIGRTSVELKILSPEERAPLIRTQLETGGLRDAELHARTKSGRLIHLLFSSKPMELSGQTHHVTTLIDISARKKAEEELRGLSGRLLRVQDDERRRLARELHDQTAQQLAAVAMNLSSLQRLSPELPARAGALLDDTRALTDRASREIRTLSYLLHSPVLENVGLVAAVRDYAAGFAKRSGVGVVVEADAAFKRLPHETELALFRIVQESLANVLKHSASPTATVCITRDAEEVCLEVRDAGHGFGGGRLSSEGTVAGDMGVGVAGMRERMRQLGGRLAIDSSTRGTTVRATVQAAERL